MEKIKKIFIVLLMGMFFFSPSLVQAKEAKSQIDWSEPVRAQLISHENNNLFTVKVQDETFKVSMIGIDVVNEYTSIKHKEKDGKVEEYEVKTQEQSIYTDLLYNNTLVLELDSKKNKYNKDGIIQAWFWANGELFQSKLIAQGRAKIDEELCNYSSCDKYYDILKSEQEYSKSHLIGLWGAKDITYLENVGGAKTGMQINIDMTLLAYGMIALATILVVVIIIILAKSKKKSKKVKKENKKTVVEKKEEVTPVENKKQEEIIKEETVIKETSENKLVEEDNKTINNIENVEQFSEANKQNEVKENKTDIVKELGVEEENKEEVSEVLKVEEIKIEDVTTSIDNVEDKHTEEVVKEEKDEIIEESEVTEENANEKITSQDSESMNKNLLLRAVATSFDPKDPRNKEVQEIIKLEYIIIDDNLNSNRKDIFVKPMRNIKLSKICKAQNGYRQDQIDNGLLLEEAIKEFIKDVKDCSNIYVWGQATINSILKDAESKLIPEDFEELKEILDKSVNYKNEFAERQEITPCGLSRAMETFGLPKSEDQITMMECLYKAERE